MQSESGTYTMEVNDSGETVLTLRPEAIKEVLPPENLYLNLETNVDARYPFPQLRNANPADPRSLEAIKWITLHHSAGKRATTNIDYWHRYHTRTKQWSRVGYHVGIAARFQGEEIGLFEMNPPWVVSWHDTRNYDTFAICLAGNLSRGYDDRPTAEQLDCFGRAAAFYVPMFKNLVGIVGHKRWSDTQCPGDLGRWGGDLIEAGLEYGIDITQYLVPHTDVTVKAHRSTPKAYFDVLRGVPLPTTQDEHYGRNNASTEPS